MNDSKPLHEANENDTLPSSSVGLSLSVAAAATDDDNVAVCQKNHDKGNGSDNNNNLPNANAAINQQQQEQLLPIEYQLYEVDLTDPNMDPLEYTFRRFVPIPKQYYWDNTTTDTEQAEEVLANTETTETNSTDDDDDDDDGANYNNSNQHVNSNNQHVSSQDLPLKIKFWHCSIYYLGEALKKAEGAGGVIANLLGLNDGPFEYVTNRMTEEEMAASRRNVELRREEREEVERRMESAA